MSTMILIEGIDRVGKSILAKRLSDRLQIPIVHDNYNIAGIDNPVVNAEKMWSIMQTIVQLDADFISDRFHWSEAVYGWCEREQEDSIKYSQSIESYLTYTSASELRTPQMNVLMVLVQPVDLAASIREHGADLTLHNDLFNNIWHNSKLDKIRGNYNQFDEMVQNIVNWWTEHTTKQSG